MPLIQGLLKGLSVAHKDKHQALFDRIKAVLTLIAKQSAGGNQQAGSTECKMLLTELLTMLMRQHNDAALYKAYSDSLVVLIKHFWETPANHEFLTFTFKELLKKFLGGRC